MLVLTRRKNEELVLTVPPSAKATTIIVTPLRDGQTAIGVLAPKAVKIDRAECLGKLGQAYP
jgi:sRNA-binding carbon storage regulator CsrA